MNDFQLLRSRPGRLLAGLAAALAAVTVVMIATASSAAAIDIGLDCKEAPEPTGPDSNLVAFIDPTPPEEPSTADPFVEAPAPVNSTWFQRLYPEASEQPSVVQTYGYGGLNWSTYDLGCGPEAGRDPMAVIFTGFANLIMTFANSIVAVAGELAEVTAEPTFLGVFDPLLSGFAGDVGGNLFGVLFR